MLNFRLRKELILAETEKIKEKRKATEVAKTKEEKIIVATGKVTIGIIISFFTGLAICLAIWRIL